MLKGKFICSNNYLPHTHQAGFMYSLSDYYHSITTFNILIEIFNWLFYWLPCSIGHWYFVIIVYWFFTHYAETFMIFYTLCRNICWQLIFNYFLFWRKSELSAYSISKREDVKKIKKLLCLTAKEFKTRWFQRNGSHWLTNLYFEKVSLLDMKSDAITENALGSIWQKNWRKQTPLKI